MKKRILFILFCLYFFPTYSKRIIKNQKIASRNISKTNTPRVRVLLEQQLLSQKKSWLFHCPHGFWITLLGKNGAKIFYPDEWLNLNCKDGNPILGKTILVTDRVTITPRSNTIHFNQNEYHGVFEIIKNEDQLYCINTVPLEQYVCSVLKTESWPGWPLEVNMVFAIMTRTYVLSMIEDAKKRNRIYHVKNTNHHQTYAGVHDSKVIHQAVKKTEGTILSYENKPILAMFDSCCGGVIPAKISDFNFEKAPYLARKKACKYCKNFPIYSWNATYEYEQFYAHIQKKAPDIGKIKKVRITKRDKAGLVLETMIAGTNSDVYLSGKDLYGLLPEAKSFSFSISQKRKQILISGKGYGHHLGLCQWGAKSMVDHGYSYKKILSFYYPGTKILKFG